MLFALQGEYVPRFHPHLVEHLKYETYLPNEKEKACLL